MQNIIKIVLGIFLTFTFLNAELLEQNGEKDGFNVKLTSTKALVTGSNEFLVELSKDSKVVETAKVKVKFFMPEMPGMPYMESKDVCKKSGTAYECNINFSMNGTWQFLLLVKDDADDEYKYKGSVNLGQASHHHHH